MLSLKVLEVSTMRKLTLIMLGVIFVLAGTSFAFHDGGVAECGGCHSMHFAESGQYLLVKSDTSST